MSAFLVSCSDNLISYYFDLNNTEVDKVGEAVFKKQLYQCMISQALELKGDIETRRAGNTYGIIVWQYNGMIVHFFIGLPKSMIARFFTPVWM